MILSAMVSVGCAVEKQDATDDFSDLDGVDQKADAFSTHMKIVGSLDYGQTSDRVTYSKTPRYRTFKFGGSEGDQIDVWVRSEDGDALAWVLDNHWHILGKNDDADGTTLDAHIKVTLEKSDSITHYIVFRDYDWKKSHFTVELAGANPMLACETDADCVAIPEPMCCPNGKHVAVAKGHEAEYADAHACEQPPQVCPLAVILDDRAALCDNDTHQCAMVEPADIRCGGFTRNPHDCPADYTCHYDHVPDVPGTCQPAN
ncbi:MAG TPA: hypothetical protein VL463_14165 [Kofleriaceae bacterium]|jgi:hypothetical protein|nr:hypothetical protein [Kofleriaceae bacterium]